MLPAAEVVSEILIEEERVRERVRELGAQITRDYAGSTDPIILVGVLRGAVIFMADLIRAIDATLTIDFIAVSSYGRSTKSSGVVRIFKDINESIEGAHVIIVEDIIDSGLTLAYLRDLLLRRGPASLRVCSFLYKERERDEPVRSVDYIGFTIPDVFVVGYGLDYAGAYRNLPYVGVLAPEAIRKTEV